MNFCLCCICDEMNFCWCSKAREANGTSKARETNESRKQKKLDFKDFCKVGKLFKEKKTSSNKWISCTTKK